MKRTPQKVGSETRWLYRLEDTALKYNNYANADRSIDFLREMTLRVWKNEAPESRRMPDVIAGEGGINSDGTRYSYCAGYTYIELARNHRTVLVLLHELTHALGPCKHGRKFIEVYFPLLNKYAKYNWAFLQDIAAERNILLPR